MDYEKMKREVQAKGLSMKGLADDMGMTYNGLKMGVQSGSLSVKKFEKLCFIAGIDPMDYIQRPAKEIQDLDQQIQMLKEKREQYVRNHTASED